jgi:hypothetical protein
MGDYIVYGRLFIGGREEVLYEKRNGLKEEDDIESKRVLFVASKR